MRVAVEMPCAVAPGASPVGLLWTEQAVEGLAKAMNEGRGPNGARADGLFESLGLQIKPVQGTARVDRSRRHVNGYLYVVFEAEVPDEAEIGKMAMQGISLA